MLVLLPPSEGKAPTPSRGLPLDLSSLSFPTLTPVRGQLLKALVTLAQGPSDKAIEALGLSPNQAAEVEKDARLLTAHTLPAASLYTGVLYDALGIATLSTGAKRRATRSIVVTSALFGAVRLNDRLPPYRLSPAARLPRIASIAGVWRAPLDEALVPTARGLVVDLRSSSYAAMWKPVDDLIARTVSVRVLHETRPGDPSSRTIVSHFNKATKGRLVREVLADGATARTPLEFAEVLRGLGYVVDAPARTAKKPQVLDVVVATL